MRRPLPAVLAILLELEAILELLLVLVGMIIDATADRAFKLDEVFLGHNNCERMPSTLRASGDSEWAECGADSRA